MNTIKNYRNSDRPRNNRASRRGVTVVLTAFLLSIFLAAAAFSVDIAYMQLTRAKLRAATDASARAAGEAFSRLQSLSDARQAARDIASVNEVAGTPLLLRDADVVEGNTAFHNSGAVSRL